MTVTLPRVVLQVQLVYHEPVGEAGEHHAGQVGQLVTGDIQAGHIKLVISVISVQRPCF